MEELLVIMVIKLCDFDNNKIDKEVRIECMEHVVNCMVGKSEQQAKKCLEVVK